MICVGEAADDQSVIKALIKKTRKDITTLVQEVAAKSVTPKVMGDVDEDIKGLKEQAA
jgi:hypothetical protein